MNYIYLFLFGFIILLIIAIVVVRMMVKKKEKKKEIPQDILEKFEQAEKMLKDSGGEMHPQEVLWRIYQERNKKAITAIIAEQTPKIPTVTKPKLNLSRLFKRR